MNSNNNSIFRVTPKVKMADAIEHYHGLLTVLPRLGIQLGFGEKTIEQLCNEYDVSQTLFMLICRVYVQDDYYPDSVELEQCPMADILQYLMMSHKDYLSNKLPHIERHLSKLLQSMNANYSTMIADFYENFKKEVSKHFAYEEEVVFPYLQKIYDANGDFMVSEYERNTFSQQHDDIEDTLNDLTNLLLKYIPSEIASDERVDMLMDMYSLMMDIRRHSMMEDRILLPYIRILESKNR